MIDVLQQLPRKMLSVLERNSQVTVEFPEDLKKKIQTNQHSHAARSYQHLKLGVSR